VGFVVPLVSLVGIGIAANVLRFPKTQSSEMARRHATRSIALAKYSLVVNAWVCFLGILYYACGYAGDRINRIHCEANIRVLGEMITMYAHENSGQLPPDFQAILLTQDVTPGSFICPSSDDAPAPAGTLGSAVSLRIQNAASVVEGTSTCSYRYCPLALLKSQLTTRHVLVYENLGHHFNPGMSILRGDGSVTWIRGAAAVHVRQELQSGQNPPPSLP
jgi:hypothetical protein